MQDDKPNTSEGCLRAAYQALLRGDTAERDRLCKRAEALLQAEHYASAVERLLAKDFYITPSGVCIPTEKMAKSAGVFQ